MKSDIRQNILPLLIQLKQELSEITISLRSEYMIENDNYEEIEIKRNELNEIKIESEMKIRRAESSYQREKELFDQNALLHSKEMDGMETRLVMLRDTALEEAKITAAKRRISEAIHMKGKLCCIIYIYIYRTVVGDDYTGDNHDHDGDDDIVNKHRDDDNDITI